MVTLTRKALSHARQAEVAKPENAPYKLNASGGLFLQVMPNGSKRWRLRYFYLGKEKMLSVGFFLATGLQAAKGARDAAKKVRTHYALPTLPAPGPAYAIVNHYIIRGHETQKPQLCADSLLGLSAN